MISTKLVPFAVLLWYKITISKSISSFFFSVPFRLKYNDSNMLYEVLILEVSQVYLTETKKFSAVKEIFKISIN